jgi:hypothetical protein
VFVGLFAVILAACFLVVAAAVRANAIAWLCAGFTIDDKRLDGLPPGNYEARVWHPRLRGDTEKTGKPVTIASNEPARAAFVVSLKSEWRVPRRIVEPYKGSEGG